MALERGLGKGLGALLGDAAFQTQESGALSLPISQVEPGLKQPRKRFEETALQDLADSIRTHGIIQPLTVRRLSSGYYQIVAGERRWRAAKLAGLAEVPVVIIDADDRKVMELGLIENLQREDLNPVEEANGYQVLIEEYGLTQEDVAQRVGKSRPAVANALRLLSLPDPVLQLLEEGRLTAGHARAILSVGSGALQMTLAKKVLEDELSVRQTETLAKRLAAGQHDAPAPASPLAEGQDLSIYYKEAERTLAAKFGRNVHIVSGKKKGKVELEYYNTEDLTALLELLEQLPAGGKGGQAPLVTAPPIPQRIAFSMQPSTSAPPSEIQLFYICSFSLPLHFYFF